MKKSHKIGTICISLVLLAIFGFFVFLFFNCIAIYSTLDIDRGDLLCEELTFYKYERRNLHKGGVLYEIYFEEYEKPFYIDSITHGKLDKEALKVLTEKETLTVYFLEGSHRDYDYRICEMSSDSTTFLSLTDYIEANKNNQKVGMIICPIMILCWTFLAWIFWHMSKLANLKDDLGRLRIEYVMNGNVIRVYNALRVCSLVINDEIADQYWGVVGNRFSLRGSFELEGKTVFVEARMGYANMRLFCDEKLVAKELMCFG